MKSGQGKNKIEFIDPQTGAILVEVFFTFLAQLLLSFGVIILFTVTAHAEVMSFQDWKKQKIDEAQAVAKMSEHAPLPASVAETSPMTVGKGKSRDRNQLNLQIAQELSIEDYFALYLSQFSDKSAFVDAAKKMNSDEVAELLLTLKSSLNKTDQSLQNLSLSSTATSDSGSKK